MFQVLNPLSADPILGLMARFKEDNREHKLDLGVGVFRTAEGLTPILKVVKAAEKWLLENETSKTYVGPAGDTGFNRLIGELALGKTHSVLDSGRAVFVQTPGGCGALRVAAELIVRAKSDACIWVSDPTWANHQPLLGDAGLEIKTYRYYDYNQHELRINELLEDLAAIPNGDYVLLHACCHNPCGADLSQNQWQQVADIIKKRSLIPFVDMAYQGFGEGIDEDAYGLRLLADAVPELLVSISCSKNFGLYRERTGAVGVVTNDSQQAGVVSSHLANIVRGIYSMPPAHGASIVAHILADPDLYASWTTELRIMRERISGMRSQLVEAMREAGAGSRFDFIEREKGMFSFLGLSAGQVETLAKEHAVYMVGSSRINVAGLNTENLSGFCHAVLDVI